MVTTNVHEPITGANPQVHEGSRSEYDSYDDEPEDFGRSARGNVGALPWWITSVVVHALLIFLTMLIVLGGKLIAQNTEDVPHAQIVTKPPKKEKPVIQHKVKSKSQVNIEADADRPFYTPEKLEVSESEVETENEERSEFPARGHQDAVSTIPAEGTGTIGFFGVGSGGASGAYGWRTGGGRKRRAMKFGGSQRTEESVDLGLEWLKWHQEEEGYWDRVKYSGNAQETGKWSATTMDNVGVSGLALLAFLGAGHTERHGKYKRTVQKAVQWLTKNQTERGMWSHKGSGPTQMYRNTIATMALSEASGMARVPSTVTAAQKAVDGLVWAQKPYAAWNYWPYKQTKESHVNDSSQTIWAAMALKSAKTAGLKVPGTALAGTLKWIDHAQILTDAQPGDYNYKGGRTYYRGTLDKPMGPTGVGASKKTSLLLTAAGGVIRVFWGQDVNHPGIVGPCNILLEENLPGTTKKENYYGWYYATLLMFQKGGEHWDTWNKAMQPHLLGKQRKDGTVKKMKGSWDPEEGPGMSAGGRVFSTALNCLSLEVYYRYLPMYETGK